MSYPLEGYPSLQARKAQLERRESLEPIPGDNFYIQGPTLSTRSWESKRNQLIEGGAGSLTLSAGEINAWFSTNFRSSAAPAGEESKGLSMVPNVPNIGINAPSFKIDRMQIGGATVPLPGILGGQFLNALLKAYSQAEEYSVIRDAWDRVEAVKVSNGALILTMGTP